MRNVEELAPRIRLRVRVLRHRAQVIENLEFQTSLQDAGCPEPVPSWRIGVGVISSRAIIESPLHRRSFQRSTEVLF
jgi:hypothetical protein